MSCRLIGSPLVDNFTGRVTAGKPEEKQANLLNLYAPPKRRITLQFEFNKISFIGDVVMAKSKSRVITHA